MTTRSLLFISSSDFDAVSAKGVAGMIAERSEGGYFDKVISVHPLATKSRTIQIDGNHELVEFGFDALPGGARWRPLRLAYAPLYVVRAVLGIRRLIRENQIDIVRASDPYWAGAIGWLSAVGLSTRLIVSIHADWDTRHRLDPELGAPKLLGSRHLAKVLERFVLSRASHVLCIRKSLFDYAVASGASPQGLRLIPHGIDLSPFEGADRMRGTVGSVSKKSVCFVGRISRENYIDDVFEVARRLALDSDCQITIAGDGPELERLKSQTELDLRLSEAISYPGFVPRDRAISLRLASDVNLVPMGGFSLIEAAASGNPVVAYDSEWHSELIEDGVTGKLVREADVEELYTATRSLLDDPTVARRLGSAARVKAFERHAMDAVYTQRARVYQEIMSQ